MRHLQLCNPLGRPPPTAWYREQASLREGSWSLQCCYMRRAETSANKHTEHTHACDLPPRLPPVPFLPFHSMRHSLPSSKPTPHHTQTSPTSPHPPSPPGPRHPHLRKPTPLPLILAPHAPTLTRTHYNRLSTQHHHPTPSPTHIPLTHHNPTQSDPTPKDNHNTNMRPATLTQCPFSPPSPTTHVVIILRRGTKQRGAALTDPPAQRQNWKTASPPGDGRATGQWPGKGGSTGPA